MFFFSIGNNIPESDSSLYINIIVCTEERNAPPLHILWTDKFQQQGEITRDVVPCVFINNYSNGIPVTTNSTVDGIKWAVAPEKQTGKMQEHV